MAIRAMSDFEHVQTKMGMYVPRNDCPIHLLSEIIDNSADEVISGYADKVTVGVNNYTKSAYVEDNGRGIPIKSPALDKECPIVIATSLRSGGKFDNDLYEAHSGLHGVGVAVVNALSNKLIITVKDTAKKHRRYTFNNSDSTDIVPEKISHEDYSTRVEFFPCAKYFDSLVFPKNEVIEKLKCLVASVNKNITVILKYTDEKNHSEDIKIENTLENDCMKDCVKTIKFSLSGVRTSDEGKKIKDTMDISLGYSDEVKQSKFTSIVNTLKMDNGLHRKFIEGAVSEYMFNRATKLNKHVKQSDMLYGSNIFTVCSLSDPSFLGQGKAGLTGKSSQYSHLFIKENIFKVLDKNRDFIDEWIDIIEEYRKSMDTSKTLKVKKNRNKVDVEDLKDCTSKNLEERELYIVEGQSAGGTLLRARDVKRHAVLPLRGKILNVLNASFDKILKSETLAKIFNTIGVKPNDPDVSQLRYSKVVILTDADVDGLHIAALLISFFNKFAKQLIDNGNLYVGVMPLFGTTVKGKFIPIYDEASLSKYKGKSAINRFKGLGEMDANELKVCAFDESERRLIRVTSSTNGVIEEIWNNKKDIISGYTKGVF